MCQEVKQRFLTDDFKLRFIHSLFLTFGNSGDLRGKLIELLEEFCSEVHSQNNLAIYSYKLCLTERSLVKMNLSSCPVVAFYNETKTLLTNYSIVLMKNDDAFTVIFGNKCKYILMILYKILVNIVGDIYV